PLDTMIRAYPTTAPLVVSRQGQFPAVTLSFNLAPRAALGDAVAAVEATTRQLGLPASIQGSFQGTAQAFRASLANEPLLIAAALVAVYIVLGVLYESYIHPLTILSTLPSAGVGAILALLVSREDLTVIALIGIILLIGIVKKNAIMMIDFALEAERRQGQSPGDAIYQACLLRFRPIMMTTMAALLAALPLALGRGVGSELRRPLGIAIVGGLLVSQLASTLPGAEPDTMATSVAAPLERQFGHIAGLTEMTSTSYLGSTSIALQFDLSRNIDGAARDVQAAINAARGYLPPNLPNNP